MADHDVAVVGAGPVGLLLACLLAQRGVDVVVLEARDGPDRRSRAIGIHPPGWAALDAVGVGGRVREEALALEGGEVICDRKVLASLSFAQHQRVLILPQHRTDALLRQRLHELSPPALRVGCAVARVRDAGEEVAVSMADGRDVSAAVLVAADGVRSGIRSQSGIPWRSRPGAGWYAMADLPDERREPRAQLHCERGGLVESFPLPAGRRRWVASDPQRSLGDPAQFVETIRARTGIRLDPATVPAPTLFRARQHRASRLVHGRIVLVGDAAHETSPIGGQGMNLGWAAAHRLAAAIDAVLRGEGGDLRAYERSAMAAAARAHRRSLFYMTMGRPARGPALLLRNAAIRALGTPLLRARTTDMITMRGAGGRLSAAAGR